MSGTRQRISSDYPEVGETYHARMVIAVPVDMAVREVVRVVVVRVDVDPALLITAKTYEQLRATGDFRVAAPAGMTAG
jgi:hypothetical protein